ncbi:MAG: RNA polymerase sigma factor [Clostridia bacterium]|nr:RNA polymerase sigma factor [Clostridia bacterium]
MDDRRIIELFLRRDESALRLAQSEYGASLKRIALSVTGDEGVAEECLNDAWLEAWNRIPPNEPYGYLYAFLARIVRCRSIDRMDRENAKKRSAVTTELTQELEDCLPSAVDVHDEAEARRLMRSVNAFLGGLSQKKRSVFLRRYWFFDPIESIAERCGMNAGAVKMTLMRTRRKLWEHLQKEGFAVCPDQGPKGENDEQQ